MIRFHMTDILPLLPIPQPPRNKSSYYVPCPSCDDIRKRNGHLNINLVKDVFRCPRCGFAGGVLDLYAHYANVSRDEARNKIIEKLCVNDSGIRNSTMVERKPPAINEYPLADIETRDATYNALLSKLSLASDHRENLIGRGLSDKVIEEKKYRTTPAVGLTALARQLQDSGLYLSGVPGFFRKNGQWTLTATKRGILIPVRDLHGRIQGLQIRRDYVEKRKFRWVSSSECQDGCKAEGWTHLAGAPCEEIILIEGPMKADIVNHLTGRTALAIPGVNSLTQIQSALEGLIAVGLKRVQTSFDMDMMKNFYVQNAYTKLLWMLDDIGLEFGSYVWNPYYNGLDDYIWKYICGN